MDISNLSLTDFGAGNGYFVAAALESNFKNVYGYEVSNNCVNFANEMFGSKILKSFSIPKTLDVIKNVDTEINKLFKKKNSFKGKIGIFDIEDNKINHRLNFYQINDGKLKEIF